MDYIDHTKSYNWETQWVKTSEVVLWAETLTESKIASLDDKIALKSIVAVAKVTTTWGAAAEAITIAWVLSTDEAIVSLWDWGTSTVTIVSIATTANTLTITFSADPWADTIIQYAIVR